MNIIELGIKKQKPSTLFSSKPKEVTYCLVDYPVVFLGANSSGKIHCALNLLSQLALKEGYILFSDGVQKSVNSSRPSYHLNFFNKYSEGLESNKILEHIHCDSIDPINPLIGNAKAFQILFGEQLGLIIHDIALEKKSNGILIDYQDIQEMIQWDNFKNSSMPCVVQYLLEHDEASHAKNCRVVFQYTDIIKYYTLKGTFSIKPSVDVRDILEHQWVLQCFFSVWYSEEHQTFNYPKVGDFLGLQIQHFTQQLCTEFPDKKYWQNIAMMDFEYTFSHRVFEYVLRYNKKDHKNLNHWIFAGYTPHQTYHLDPQECNKLLVIDAAETLVLMQSNTYASELPDKLKIKCLSHIKNLPNIFYDKSPVLHELAWGEAYTMLRVDGQYELVHMRILNN